MSASDSRLQVSRISVHFGGAPALDEVSLEAAGGRITGLIGPNGAGKTTLFNAVTGLTPCRGEIFVDGVDYRRIAAYARARLGIARSFQTPRVIEELSTRDNVLLGALTASKRPLCRGMLKTKSQRRELALAAERADEQIAAFGLQDLMLRKAGTLSHGQRRRVELARALAGQPKVLLLDEPAAGLGADDANELLNVVNRMAGPALAILLVEHSVDIVMRLAQYVFVLDAGRMIARGSPREVVSNPVVVSAYLGTQDLGPPPDGSAKESGRQNAV